MGSVPNCWKQIAVRYPIRWFKCKLKPPKKLVRASTADHDLFFQISHIWPTFIFGVSNAPDTFFFTFSGKNRSNNKIFVKKTYRHQLQPMTHFLTNQKFDLLSYIYIINFLNLPVRALIHDLQKKTYGHQLGPMTHFLRTLKFDLLLYIGEKCLRTHLQNFLCVP